MDRIDRWILDLLQRDADITNSELADKVGLAASSCLRRVQRLKETGVIERRVALANPRKLGRNLKVIISVELVHHGSGVGVDWMARVVEDPRVAQAYGTTGEQDAFVILNLRDMEEYQDVSEELFGQDPMVARYYTYFVREARKCDTAIPTDVIGQDQ
ncbi:Lrp/AsnC family transcriptional regulator [Aestuariispira insulae]|uniref:AsnC family transcriptional regulator n=1 Tax=Aestuariispira insulae TaxID=1461337 RepID=A0A3D9HKB5_9PROT|nr:Lrp/AsnC family transcriptional regulator [Aestuariispira insulae]RED49939.1 AsnC family transcriptional regulator [Aestuariispira insulae]